MRVTLSPHIEEGFTYWGSIIPAQVDIILTGNRADIALLPASGIRAYIDLTYLTVGTHNNIVIGVEGVPDHIDWAANPSVVDGIEIDLIATAEFLVEPLPTPTLPDLDIRYSFSEIRVYPESVIANGPRRILAEIEMGAVRAAFDISNHPLVPGPITREGVVVAVDNQMNRLSGVEFYPPAVTIQLDINENTIPIAIDINDNLLNFPSDYELISVTSNIDEIEVWGDFDEMDDIYELERINFRDLNNEGQISYLLELPPGVYTEIDGIAVPAVEIVITVVYEEPPPEPIEEETDDLAWIGEKGKKRRIA